MSKMPNLTPHLYPAVKLRLKRKFPKRYQEHLGFSSPDNETFQLHFTGDDPDVNISIGEFQDAIIYCLSLQDLDVISCQCTFDLQSIYTIKITEIAD